jgi:transposase
MDDENRPTTPPQRHESPPWPNRTHLVRDERIQVQTLHRAGYSQRQIAEKLEIGRKQVRTAVHGPATPRKRSGHPSTIDANEKRRIIEAVCSSKEYRRASWPQLAARLGMPDRVYAVRNALRNEGFARYVARRKPPISERNRLLRLSWALTHVHWTPEQWKRLFWTDETWTNGGRHTKTWVTRRQHETFEPTCIVERHQRRAGWMFWGSFYGATKGPCVVWEKDWGSITSASYREHVVPLIHDQIQRYSQETGQELILIQDNAPSHNARATREELRRRGISYETWPPFSPDLNAIESVWNWMKQWIQDRYDDGLVDSQPIRGALQEAWDALPETYLQELLDSMPARCQAVINAEGRHTQY